MTSISVNVDIDDIIEAVDDEYIEREYKRRFPREPGRIDQILATETVNQAADELRRIGLVNLAYKLEEVREDFLFS